MSRNDTKQTYIWIVEICYEPHAPWGKWEPTVGAGLSRYYARIEMKNWQSRNPETRFRIRRYVSAA